MSNLFLNNHPDVRADLIKNTESNYTLSLEPLYPGYGYTIGNSLRRILLSSIPGFGVTKIKINDLTHEYQPIPGVVEDALQVVLNLKNLRPKILTDEDKVVLTLIKNTEGQVLASSFKSANATITNSDEYICTLNKGHTLEIEIEISRGVGYLSMDDVNLSNNKDARQILVDTIFSPVVNVSLDVSKVRVGDKTNFDKIDISFDIDKTVSAQEVVNYAFDILIDIMNKSRISLNSIDKSAKSSVSKSKKDDKEQLSNNLDEIRLPEKIKKILAKNEITTNTQLQQRIIEVGGFTGIGVKAVEDIQNYIETL